MKQYKKPLILSSLAILLPIPVQLFLGREWSVSLALPLLLLAAHWFCLFWTFKDPRQSNQGRKPTLMVLWLLPILSMVISAIDYCFSIGLPIPMHTLGCLLFGAMFVVIGNYLPKVKQNATLGIKIYWTYTSEENWNATHRFGGKVWAAGGIVIALAAFLPEYWSVGLMFVSIFALVLIPLVYSCRYFRMQKARGDVLTEVPPMLPMNSKIRKLSLVLTALLLAFVAILMFTGDIAYQFTENQLLVQADFYDDIAIPYDQIEDLELREYPVDGSRQWGYGSARLLLGSFQNDEFGPYTRYTYTGAEITIVLCANDWIYVLSAETPAQTKALYDALCEKAG